MMQIKLLQVGSLGTNCYLLVDEEQNVCAVIDPGGSAQRIINAVEAAGLTPAAIFLTHGHYDHTGAVAELQAKWPEVPTYLNKRDVYEGDGRMQQLFPPVPHMKNYDEGDTLSVGGLTVTVMATPGHTHGSVCYICQDALFSGDTLFAGSCGRTDLPGGDWATIHESLRFLAALPTNYTVYPGHGGATTLADEKKYNPYMR